MRENNFLLRFRKRDLESLPRTMQLGPFEFVSPNMGILKVSKVREGTKQYLASSNEAIYVLGGEVLIERWQGTIRQRLYSVYPPLMSY